MSHDQFIAFATLIAWGVVAFVVGWDLGEQSRVPDRRPPITAMSRPCE